MAKKTNKTDHVLNLISGGSAKGNAEEGEDRQTSSTPPPVDPTANVSPQVSIVHSSAKDETQVADSIKSSLEKELKAVSTSAEKIPEPEAPPVPEVEKEVELEPTPIEKAVEQEVPEEVTEETVSVSEEVTEEDIYENRFRRDLEERLKEPSPDYTFVNVMEYLVRDRVQGYMEQFGNCTCSRCIEDTSALTLTHLPAKYVVVNKAAIPPLLDYYGHKFAGQITVEITKACIRVNECPHHNR